MLHSASRRYFTTRGAGRIRNDFQIGQEIEGYKVVDKFYSDKFELQAYRFQHLKTGADHLHLDCADTDNVFGVAIKTLPSNDCGLPHILEHMALCGSKQFPVRDPFFNMLKRSLATYMNAMTFPDLTLYPFSTQNSKDFSNLLQVYLSSVFFPLLRETDFWQEGHRFEYIEKNDPDSELTIQGVVYNEMQGAMDSSTVFEQELYRKLFPDSIYRFNSGGDPPAIPLLSHDDIIDFHKRNYHPSNSQFYTYGDLPVENHLKVINRDILSKFDKLPQIPSIELSKTFDSPKYYEFEGPVDPNNTDPTKRHKIARSWVLDCDTSVDALECLALDMLSSILVTNPGSPMYKALIESNIGSGYTPYVGYSCYSRQPTFSIGIQDISESDVEKVQKLITEKIKETSVNGFSLEEISAQLHSYEISLSKKSTNYGLRLLMMFQSEWNHGGDPKAWLLIDSLLSEMKEAIESDPEFFQKLIKKHLIDNNHRADLVMIPKIDFTEKTAQNLKKELREKSLEMSVDEKTEILNSTQVLQENIALEEDVSVLPTLHREDIALEEERFTVTKDSQRNVNYFSLPMSTSGIGYIFAASHDLKAHIDLMGDNFFYLDMLTSATHTCGTTTMDYTELNQAIRRRTGEIDQAITFVRNENSCEDFEVQFSLSSYSLDRNLHHMFDLMKTVFFDGKFSGRNERLETLIKSSASNLAANLESQGHVFAIHHVKAALSLNAYAENMVNGLPMLSFYNKLGKELSDEKTKEQTLNAVSSRLQQVHRQVSDIGFETYAMTGDHHSMTPLQKEVASFSEECMNQMSDEKKEVYETRLRKEYERFAEKYSKPTAFVHSSLQVNFCAAAVKTGVYYTHKDSAPLQLLSTLLSRGFLHKQIREMGGAYGSGCAHCVRTGVMRFFSYRDPHPNVKRTFQHFEDAWKVAEEFTQEDLDQALLALFSDLDAPQAPGSKGMDIVRGLTFEQKQEFRNQIFATTLDDITRVAKQYLADKHYVKAFVGVPDCVSVLATDKSVEGAGEGEDWQVEKLLL